jgi:hypothetical protein
MVERTCDHENCECAVKSGESYCSQACRDAAKKGIASAEVCACGHDGCEATAA